jgi:hypothetical protein
MNVEGEIMSTATAPQKKNKPKKAGPGGLPDERFWIKYSPHHELPLSVTSSLFLHAVVYGTIGLVLAGFLSGLFGHKQPPEVTVIGVAGGGGGDPNGIDGGTEAVPPTGKEVTEKNKSPDPVVADAQPKDLTPPTTKAEPLIKPTDGPSRLFEQVTLSPKNMSDVARAASDRLASIAAKGQGGNGTDGGLGEGNGRGTGNQTGNGSGGTIKSEARQLRWTMIFRTHSGSDYLKQLHDLGAILATPESNDEYLVFRDLGKRPLIGKREGVGNEKGLRWIDDRADSVPALAQSMGLKFRPPYVVAFFPAKLEEQLRKIESDHFKGDESMIEETIFRIEQRQGGKYFPIFQDMRLKH